MDSASKLDKFKVIEEQMKDSNVVTFKWLSRKLQVHNSVAKQLLQEFLDQKNNKDKYVVTLVVYGKKNNGDLLLSIVKESELTNLQNEISIIDQHIYSIQPPESTFDPDLIYNIDKATYELKQLSLSSIKYNKEIIRKSTRVQAIRTPVAEPSKQSGTAKVTPVEEKPVTKKQDSPSENAKSNEKINSKLETKKSTTKPAHNSKGSISSFFAKQSAKPHGNSPKSIPEQVSVANGTSNKDSDTQPTEEVIKSSPLPEKTNGSEVQNSQSKTETMVTDSLAKRIERKETSKKSQNTSEKAKKSKKSKPKTKQKKMKRIILQSDSSSNSEASEDESHISEPELEPEPEPVVEPKNESPAVIVTYGKKRKRKVIEKTVMDDEGFLHTNKEVVYESCSSDENDVSNNENLDTNKRQKTEDSDNDNKPKNSKNEEIKSQPQSQKTKQSSIMSFFKKPQKT